MVMASITGSSALNAYPSGGSVKASAAEVPAPLLRVVGFTGAGRADTEGLTGVAVVDVFCAHALKAVAETSNRATDIFFIMISSFRFERLV